MKKILLFVFALLLCGILSWPWIGERLLFAAMQKRASASLGTQTLDAMAGGLNIALCGAGSPMPDPTRAGPCTLIQAGDQLLVIDAGSGSPRNFGPMGIPAGEIDALLLTHFHSDHIDGLGELMLQRWAGGGHDQTLPIYGPPGVRQIVDGFNQVYQQDFGYRVAHHGEAILPRSGAGGQAVEFAMPGPDGQVVYQQAGLKVIAFAADHAPIEPAVGYRIEYAGRSIVLSGDTIATPALQQMSQGVDVLVSEGLAPELVGIIRDAALETGNQRVAQIMDDILNYHITPVQAAAIAARAEVGYLLFTHIVPPLPVKLLEMAFLRGVSEVYSGPVQVGRDGTWLHLPGDSREIRTDSLLSY